MPTYQIECLKCGKTDEVFKQATIKGGKVVPASEFEPPECCGQPMTRICNCENETIWWTDCPTASGNKRAQAVRRIESFVDDGGREHKIKYHHGTPVRNTGAGDSGFIR